jgi:hypothetical protein
LTFINARPNHHARSPQVCSSQIAQIFKLAVDISEMALGEGADCFRGLALFGDAVIGKRVAIYKDAASDLTEPFEKPGWRGITSS